jgi:large subunit ribosomal protein L20
VRINAAVRAHDLSYSQFMRLLKNANLELDRKVLADLALTEPVEFADLVARVVAAGKTLPAAPPDA